MGIDNWAHHLEQKAALATPPPPPSKPSPSPGRPARSRRTTRACRPSPRRPKSWSKCATRWLNAEGLSEAERKKRTLTNLYNARPTWLDLAHKKLDAAVFAAYGWPDELSEEEILERLLKLNLERAGEVGEGGRMVMFRLKHGENIAVWRQD